jgi:flagellar protein FliJ
MQEFRPDVMNELDSKKSGLLRQADEKGRKVRQLTDSVVAQKTRIAELTKQIVAEEQKTGVSDASDISYSLLAKSAQAQWSNCQRTLDDLEKELAAVTEELSEVQSQLGSIDRLQNKSPKP